MAAIVFSSHRSIVTGEQKVVVATLAIEIAGLKCGKEFSCNGIERRNFAVMAFAKAFGDEGRNAHDFAFAFGQPRHTGNLDGVLSDNLEHSFGDEVLSRDRLATA